jgi:hypothetical protein
MRRRYNRAVLALAVAALALFLSGCALVTLAGKVISEHPCAKTTCPAGEVCYETATASDNMSNVQAICAPPLDPKPTDPPQPDALTCVNKDCAEGYTCQDTPGGPQCVQPEPPATSCPLPPLAEGRAVWVDAKLYGQGLDSEPRTDDPAICKAIHGQDWHGSSCHFESPSLSPEMRSICERHYLGGCPTWQWRVDAWDQWKQCFMAPGAFNCDHHGSAGQALDDPKTPTFDGTPAECGVQRDTAPPVGDILYANHPMAGPFVIAHGLGEVRACSATPGKGCGRCRTPMADGCTVNH